MRVFRLCQWVFGITLAGCTLNPQPFPPAELSSDAGATGSSDGSKSPDAGLQGDSGSEMDTGVDAPADAQTESGDAGDAASDAVSDVVEGG